MSLIERRVEALRRLGAKLCSSCNVVMPRSSVRAECHPCFQVTMDNRRYHEAELLARSQSDRDHAMASRPSSVEYRDSCFDMSDDVKAAMKSWAFGGKL